MSAPSELHEARVAVLADLASLAGYSVSAAVDDRLRPDLVRLHRSVPALMIADAKATERPTDEATVRRLLGYASAATLWAESRFDVDIALCHGPDPGRSWSTALHRIVDYTGARVARTTYADIDDATAVTVVTIRR